MGETGSGDNDVSGYIYLIQAADFGPVKIGYTSVDVAERLRALQVGSPLKLHVRAVIEGDQRLEKQLHQKYEERRLHGEWFEPSYEMEVAWNVKLRAERQPFYRYKPSIATASKEFSQLTERQRQIVAVLEGLDRWVPALRVRKILRLGSDCSLGPTLGTLRSWGWAQQRSACFVGESGRYRYEWAHRDMKVSLIGALR